MHYNGSVEVVNAEVQIYFNNWNMRKIKECPKLPEFASQCPGVIITITF
jgi:hypothetical protein